MNKTRNKRDEIKGEKKGREWGKETCGWITLMQYKKMNNYGKC